jgi:glycosyltransferase involved in cell wall biosynthesis
MRAVTRGRVLGASEPTVSVAVIAYNQAHLLPATVASAFEQTRPPDEVVVADDGSVDDTPAVLAELRSQYGPRLRPVFAAENRGITANVNAAVDACTGDLVAWLDGDDRFLPEKLERQVAAFRQHPDLVLCHHAAEHYRGEEPLGTYTSDPAVEEWQDEHDLVRRVFPVAGSSVMFVRDAPRFRPEITMASDWLWAVETAMRGRVLRIGGVWSRYTQHENNVTSDAAGNTQVTFGDLMLTVEILEREHPELRPDLRYARAEIWYRAYWRARRRKDETEARRSLLRAFRSYPAHRGVLVEMGQSALGQGRRRKLYRALRGRPHAA